MADRFTGNFEDLKVKLANIQGEWKDLNPSQKQFRAATGGVVNWYPNTGSLNFQGNSPAVDQLKSAVLAALNPNANSAAAPKPAPKVAAAPDIASPPPASKAKETPELATGYLSAPYAESELVFALIGAVGTELEKVRSIVEDRLRAVGYTVTQVSITKDIIPTIVSTQATYANEFERVMSLMDAGNDARKKSGDNSILALGAAAFINSKRKTETNGEPLPEPKRAYIISSLKHPEEVARLREIYAHGFYLIGVHADEKRRFNYLANDKTIPAEKAEKLIDRDEDEHLPYGQKVTDAFHLSDFFVRIDGQDDHLKHSLWRILDLLFGHPYVTPTFDEYAMFLAFAASLRSADLSRQVGAVVAVNHQVVATGANDCPKAGGGLYWPTYNPKTHEIEDQEDGRDYKRGEDSNKIEQQKIIDEILSKAEQAGLDRAKVEDALKGSRIADLTEFGRVVHAEMDALLSCARARIAVQDGTVYSTTFPCHNCAKHIVAAGIRRVVFIEPYAKSKAGEFHTDSIQVGFSDSGGKDEGRSIVFFEPFVGVGPRRFFDLFSIRLGSGYPVRRRDSTGHALTWKPAESRVRLQLLPVSYLDLELVASAMFNKACGEMEKADARK